ncbi:heavy-metal-associated domain-containing protein [Halobacteria archaeon AArc-curdl1]|uniref:Heavy-metal-associated domain-containing protein n=1 Tax=Natronosalvus hydrolyticus TaxID=2979988 RepID=A0AAP2Z8R6_9EURY|nr:heavy-metal-associated domain-containing protein [Halobacteria archaeon AArc-curdl1]
MAFETKRVGIHGLNCPNCAAKVERAVTALSGVHSAAVEFDTEQAVFEYNPRSVTLNRIAHTVEQTGCDSKRFTISLDGDRIQPNGRQAAADDSDGSHDSCCDDEETHMDGHQQNRSPF